MPRTLCRAALLAIAACVTLAASVEAVCTTGAKRLTVPSDCSSVEEAFANVADGGVIEIAPGIYTFGTSGLGLGSIDKAVTLRAVVPGAATFSGAGSRPIVRVTRSSRTGKAVVFEGLRFADGRSSSPNRAGGVSVSNAEVTFVDCVFENNTMLDASTGGGALGLYGNSRAVVIRSTFDGNRAYNDGGAIYMVELSGSTDLSSLWIHGSSFTGNSSGKAGGAIYVRNGMARIADTVFDSNATDFAGGAIYGYGQFTTSAPYCNWTTPRTDLQVARSHFVQNRADEATDTSRFIAGDTHGGAVHVEDCARLGVYGSRLEENEANWGGALATYRGRMEVTDSVLRRNRTFWTGQGLTPAGGTILLTSGDASPSGPDYPSARLVLRSSLLQGPGKTIASAQVGGCLSAYGDFTRYFSGASFQSSWRANVEITDVAMVDCRTEQMNSGDVATTGGSFNLMVADAAITNLLVTRSSADGGAGTTGMGGGGVFFFSTVATLSNLVFSDSTSDGPYPYVHSDEHEATVLSGGYSTWTPNQSSPAGGILLALPSRDTSTASPFVGEEFLAYAWSGSAATLDGAGLGTPKNGLIDTGPGSHTLAVAGLSSRNATLQAAAEPGTQLSAVPEAIASGGSASLSWATSGGEFVGSVIDRGIGEVGAGGVAGVQPVVTTTYRRLAFTREGGALAERTVYVDETPPNPADPIFSDGFDDGVGGWSAVVQ